MGKSTNNSHEVILKQNRQGHYVATGFINNQPVTFLIDTGATIISISSQLARELSLPLGAAHEVRTANGNATAYLTQLNSVKLGSIELHELKASVVPNMGSKQVLLGMNFMRQLEMLQRNNQLTLRKK